MTNKQNARSHNNIYSQSYFYICIESDSASNVSLYINGHVSYCNNVNYPFFLRNAD